MTIISKYTSFFQALLKLKPRTKLTLLLASDFLLIPFIIFLCLYLRLDIPLLGLPSGLLLYKSKIAHAYGWMFYAVPLSAILIYTFTARYQSLTRYFSSFVIYFLAFRNLSFLVLTYLYGIIFRLSIPSFNTWFLFWIVLTSATSISRLFFRDILRFTNSSSNSKLPRVSIYGAGSAGAQLAISLEIGNTHIVKNFIDDDPTLWQRRLYGKPIKSPDLIPSFVDNIDQILIAMPSLSRAKRMEIFNNIQKYELPIFQIPSIDDLISGRTKIEDLKPISIDDILCRNSVPADPSLLGPGITSSIVFVTGAGGSIGSELCRQILDLKPSKLILLDISEPNLYAVTQELKKSINNQIQIISLLGDAKDETLLRKIFNTYNIDIVYHSAAYKHVPIVEENPIEGIINNVISTYILCEIVSEFSVKKMILISTDKAIRPTNIMGASKRLAELIMQAAAQQSDDINNKSKTSIESKTCYAMVRFGNVLGSSGSVVPLFLKQIKEGGPLTITHENMVRYFMTIPEAAQLVIQASVLAQGGDVFLLDMGEPVRIIDLAKQMIRLSGLSVLDNDNPNGDIEIISTGLRPGEKLYEELLIDAKPIPTQHKLIYKAKEKSIPYEKLWKEVEILRELLKERNVIKTLDLLSKLVPEWNRVDQKL
ncbi:UDP-N-acetylglucosamine 4,6-dehydratase [Prochlorococcus sp. MIT 0602]|nr:UDP-N-acetylglucosamine 4,6-dehydratase [Prochlorococcus sp. MIT 0603]KGG17943.1 UDP-N-acetylglucosamine 4,6-dehydratase [Prochlorococcus sp. MIT 0602]